MMMLAACGAQRPELEVAEMGPLCGYTSAQQSLLFRFKQKLTLEPGVYEIEAGDAVPLALEVLGEGRPVLEGEMTARVEDGQLEDFGSQVFEDGGRVDSSGGTDTASGGGSELKVTVDTSHGELTHKNSGGEEKKVRIHFSKKGGEMEKRVGKGIID